MNKLLSILSIILLANIIQAKEITDNNQLILSGQSLLAIHQGKTKQPDLPDLDFSENYNIYILEKSGKQYIGKVPESEVKSFPKIIVINLFWPQIKEKVLERREKQAIAGIAKPVTKPFKPKVAFYDGYTISTKMGTIYIPEEFDYRGTARNGNRHKYSEYLEGKRRAEKRYNELKEEAKKQEKLKEEHDQQNEKLLADYQAKINKAKLKARNISEKEIWQEARNYKFIIIPEI